MGAVVIGLIAFFIFVTSRLSSPDMSVLYSELELSDSGDIVARLEDLDIPYTVGRGGAAIMVPGDQVNRVRMLMAQDGLPKGGSLGYEIFDDADAFGTTSFVQNINRVRALEGELARTIATIATVRQARVHLVMPERELFSRDQQKPSASIFLRLRGALSGEQIAAVQYLVAAAVPRLSPQNISIVDDRGNLLARGTDDDDGAYGLSRSEELRRTYERRLAQALEDLLSQSLGPGKVRAQVSAEMNFDRVTTSEELYDPNSQVARSTQFTEEESESNEGDGLDPVSVANTLPEADVLAPLGGASASNRTTRVQETVNYEISRTVLSSVRETGSVSRLSVAVLVDGAYDEAAVGEPVYVPRSDAEMQQIDALVRSTIGFDAERGDTVEVINMQFITPDVAIADEDGGLLLGLSRQDIFRIVEMLVMAVVAALVILLVVRPLLSRILEGGGARAAGTDLDTLLQEPTSLHKVLAAPDSLGLPSVAGVDGDFVPAAEGDGQPLDEMIDISKVEGRVRASSLKKVGEIVEKHPDEAVSIIRNWIHQES